MHKSLLQLLVVLSFIMSSCGMAEKHEAQEFYAKMTGINDTLDMMTTEWHTMRDEAMVKKTYNSLTPVRIKLGAYISASRSYVANVLPTKNNERVKNTMDSLLTMQSAKVADVYPAFEQLTEFTPKESVDKSITALGDDLLVVKSMTATIKKQLQLFAVKYDIKKKK